MMKKILAAFRRDVVLTVSLVLAAASCFITPPGPAYISYIDFNTLIILFCLMLIVEGLRRQNFLQYVAGRVLNRVGTVRGLVCTLVFLCFVSSMLITNDVSLITFVPFGIMVLEMADQRERVCYTVTLMTIAANLGSMFTPIGNPQNLYLFSLSGLNIPDFLLLTAPYTVGAAVLLVVSIFLGYKQSALSIEVGKTAPLNKKAITFFGVLFLLCVLTVGGFIPHEALFVVVTLALLWRSRELFAGVDYSLHLHLCVFLRLCGQPKAPDRRGGVDRRHDGRPRPPGGCAGEPDHQQRPRRHAPVRVQRRSERADRGGQPGGIGHPHCLHGQSHLL